MYGQTFTRFTCGEDFANWLIKAEEWEVYRTYSDGIILRSRQGYALVFFNDGVDFGFAAFTGEASLIKSTVRKCDAAGLLKPAEEYKWDDKTASGFFWHRITDLAAEQRKDKGSQLYVIRERIAYLCDFAEDD